MKGLWWKVLALLLMLYVVLAGLLIPLKSGIQSVEPMQLTAGQQQTIRVEGYNTHFESGEEIRAWLRLGSPRVEGKEGRDTAILSNSVKVIGVQDLSISFQVPAYLPTSDGAARASLIIDNPKDGAFVLPEAIILKQSEALAGPPSPQGWSSQIENLSASSGITFPFRGLLAETIRNQYFHVSLWFSLMILMLAAAVYAARFLISGRSEFDRRSEALTKVGLAFGMLGLFTGMVWANFTWGKPWSGDVKQNMTAIALLIYLAYFVLRASVASDQQASRIGAAYNIFAFAMLIPLLYIIPRMRASLHPGAGGNPGFGGEDLDSTMRMVFYPGIIGFTLVGLWLAQLSWRTARLKHKIQERLLG